MQYVSNISLIISHFGICLGIIQNEFYRLGYTYHFTILYVCDKIWLNVTNNSIFLSISCFIWVCVLIFLVSRLIFLRNTQNDINMRMIRLELGKTFVYLLHQWPILFFWVKYWKISFLGTLFHDETFLRT